MAVVGDGHVVFNPDADALPALFDGGLPLWQRQPIAHIQARLDREHHARLQLHVVLAQPIGAHIVHIQAQPVARAVHVEVAVGPLLDDSVQRTRQQAQFQQPLHQHPHSRVVHALRRAARRHRRHRRHLGRQHQLVEGPLFAAETAIDRKGAGDVAVVVVAQGAAGIDQQQVAIPQGGAVGGVVQHAGVVAAGHDRAIGRAAGPLLQKVLLDHRLHLPLPEARPGHLAGQFMGLGGDAGRLAQALQLLGPLAQPQLVQQGAGGHQTEGCRAAAGSAV